MKKSRPIALLTDFGTRDPYVAAMKGVLCSLAPDSPLIDITHEVPAHSVTNAAYHLKCVMPYMPDGTVIVCVVDPGVGTGRRILALNTGSVWVLAPDNGILEYLCEGRSTERFYHITKVPGSEKASKTFHGRDIFAPAAALLARGKSLRALGKRVPAPARRTLFVSPEKGGSVVRGEVLHVDGFGNIISNIVLPSGTTGGFTVSVAGRRITSTADTYGHAPAARPFYLRGSSGLLEISVRSADASRILKVRMGDTITIRRTG